VNISGGAVGLILGARFQQEPTGSRVAKPQMIRCQGQEVSLVFGWCPVQDEIVDLDAMPSESPDRANRHVHRKFTGEKALFPGFLSSKASLIFSMHRAQSSD
jgi:hypothetical protein